MPRTFKIGDEVTVWVPSRIPQPSAAKIVAITETVGKTIGVEFEEPIGPHSCDGLGRDKHCLWVQAHQIFTKGEAIQIYQKLKEEPALKNCLAVMIDIDPYTNQPISMDFS